MVIVNQDYLANHVIKLLYWKWPHLNE